jgi:SAM-dependent methyltransferase
MDGPILYDELASWWPLLSAPSDYEEAASLYARLFSESSGPGLRSLLELGSGGGNNASHLKAHFESVTLVDRSPGMLHVSRGLNPDCEHVLGDMYSVRLDRTFDCVFLHDAVCYATSSDLLRAALGTLFIHCRPGGVAVIAPDFVQETFHEGTDLGGHDGDGRALRYLEWTWDPDPADSTYVVDFAYLLREGETTSVRRDRHVVGLFPQAHWMKLLAEVGFQTHVVLHRFANVEHAAVVFVGVKPEAD